MLPPDPGQPPEQIDPSTDVTRLLGSREPCRERVLFEVYQGHFAECIKRPNVTNFRLCVQAHDEFLACFYGVGP